MKHITLLLITLLSLNSPAWGFVLGSAESGTPTIIAEQSRSTTLSRSIRTYTIVQSFLATADPFYSYSVYIEDTSPSGTITCRIDDDLDMSSEYTEQFTYAYGGGQGEWIEILSVTQPTLTASTWYIACQADATIFISVEDPGTYADGQYYYATYPAWTSFTSYGRDNVFSVKVLQ